MKCTKCILHKFAKTNCFIGLKNPKAKLVIYLDFPYQDDDRAGDIGYSQATKFILWSLKRMSLDLKDIAIEFILKCHKPTKELKQKQVRLEAVAQCKTNALIYPEVKSIVLLGTIACEYRLKKPITKLVNTTWFKNPQIFIGYNPAVIINTPSESVDIYRMIWWAAETAKLNPKLNASIKPFKYEL